MEYYAAPNVVGIFADIGILILFISLATIIFLFARWYKGMIGREEKYNILEELALEDIAKKKGIDLNKEIIKRNVYNKRSFRKEIERELLDEFFKERKEENK